MEERRRRFHHRVVVSIDSHDCQRVATKDGVINEGTIFPVRWRDAETGQSISGPVSRHHAKTANVKLCSCPVPFLHTRRPSSIRVEPT